MADYDYIVAQDGSGDFLTIEEALNATWEKDKHWWNRVWRVFRPWRIGTKPGRYTESISLSASDPNVKIVGNVFSDGVHLG